MSGLAKGWARAGAWLVVGAGAVAMLLGASALSMLAAMAQRASGKPVDGGLWERWADREQARAIIGREREARRARREARDAAREERKAMRREVRKPWAQPNARVAEMVEALHRLDLEQRRLKVARTALKKGYDVGDAVSYCRADVRLAELRYAIACAAAGAVPGTVYIGSHA